MGARVRVNYWPSDGCPCSNDVIMLMYVRDAVHGYDVCLYLIYGHVRAYVIQVAISQIHTNTHI